MDLQSYGWEEMYDATSSRTFYYNHNTGESSWDPPVIPEAAPVEEPAVRTSDWVEAVADDGRVYYYNSTTGESSWDMPPDYHAPGSAIVDHQALTVEIPALERDNSSASVAASDWVEAYSEDGRVYYYNSVTGASSWEIPADYRAPGSSSAEHPTLSLDIPSGRPFERENSDSFGQSNDKDQMSLYNASNLHLPEYSKPDDPLNSSLRSNKKSGFVSAPDEFATEFLSMSGRDSRRDNRQDDEEYPPHDQGELSRALDYLESVDWSEKNPIALSEVVLALPESQMMAAAILSFVAKQLTSFTIASFAEAHFQLDRRGSTIPANVIDKLISYQADPLKNSLTALPSNLAADAVHCFRQIQTFMSRTGVAKAGHKEAGPSAADAAPGNGGAAGNAASGRSSPRATDTSAHMDIAAYLIQNMAMASTEFCDEIYLQLCKQTRRNPSAESTELGWQLMLILLSSIPVSRRLLPYVIQYISVAVENLVDEAKKFAALCMKYVLKSAVSSPRRELPTDKEILALLLGETMDIRIKNIDKKILVQHVDSFTLVRDLETAVFQALKIAEVNRSIFGLFELRGGKPINIATTDRVVDILSAWAANTRNITDAILSGDHGLETGNSFIVDEHVIPRFIFRVKFFFPVEDLHDTVTLDLLYAQALHDCLTAHYPHTLQDALVLSAFQLQILNGDFIVGKEIREFRSSSSIKALCVAPWIDRDEISRVDAEARITTLYKKLANTPRVMARDMFLKYIQSWKVYGAKYFLVKGQIDGSAMSATTTIAHDLVLAVNPRSVIVIDPSQLTFLADYSFDQIQSWGHSFDSFALAVGAKESQTKSYFRTAQGKEIEELLRIYTSHMRKREHLSSTHSLGGD